MSEPRWDDVSRSTAAAVAMVLACGGLLVLGLLALAPAGSTPAAATGTPATGARVCPMADPVTGVTVTVRPGATTVRWDGPADGAKHTYRILRRTDPQGAWSELTTVTLAPTPRGVAVDADPPTSGKREYAVVDLLLCGATPVCGLGADGTSCASALAVPTP